jgi:uncharacterized protein YkwD
VFASTTGMSPLQALKSRFSGFAALGVFTFALTAATGVQAATADLVDIINHMRSTPAKCAGQPGLQKFVRSPELDRAAAMMASGASLQDSAAAAGYQAVIVKGINVTGSADRRALETLLANGYCPFIVDPALVELGFHQQGATTSLVLAASFTPAGGMDQTTLAVRMLVLVNEARAQGRKCGATFFPAAAPVRWNEILARVARSHSEDMASRNFFHHNSPDGSTPFMRVERAGYDYRGAAENIAAGQMSLEGAMAGWLASPGHCANLMSAEYTEMGAALASSRVSAMGAYWTQVFASPRTGPPPTPRMKRSRVA